MSSPRNASISRRDYFYPLPYPLPPGTSIPYTPGLPTTNPLQTPDKPVEPTHTLVLTSTTKQFVDIRIYKKILPQDPELPNEGGPRQRLDWAFAGTSSSFPIPDPFPTGWTLQDHPSATHSSRQWAGAVTKASWTHWLDSHHHVSTPAAKIPIDEGIMYPLTATQTLEFGSGPNYHTNQMQAYEELWTDLPILATPTAEQPTPPKYSVVLRVEDVGAGVRGCVVRVGQYCQGVVMKGVYVTVERWEFREKEGEKEVGGEWKRVVRIGDQFLPCATTFEPHVLNVGGTVKYFDYRWVVEEKVAWRDEA